MERSQKVISNMGEENAMIRVRDATKSFSSKKVLCNLNMTVKEQSIYGLLGPSGCGKTTLLSCILGLKKLESGNIDVKLRTSKQIGYMPQDTALCDNFSVEETFYFFGTFFGMKRKDIEEKMDYYLEFIGLQNHKYQLIGNCSGGQKRRVSFTVALLHDPPLLILDEPTVGLDCILAERIWEHLITISNEGKTIIITTHYIQEAENCTMIGFMRSGRLIKEKPPEELMSSYQSTDLEEIFLTLCQQMDENQKSINCESEQVNEKVEEKCELYPDNVWFSRHRFQALVIKNYYNPKRNTWETFGLLFLPFLLSVIFATAMVADPKNLKIGLLSLELPSEAGLGACVSMKKIYHEELDCKLPQYLTCPIVDSLRKLNLVIVPYNDFEELAKDVGKNRVWGSIEVAKNFTSSFVILINRGLQTRNLTTEFITSRLDGTNIIMKNLLMVQIKNILDGLYGMVLKTCGISEKNTLIPIKFNEPIYGLEEPALGDSMLPAFICGFSFYFTVMFTTSTFITDKTAGLSNRNIAGGMTQVEVILAHLVVQFVFMFLQNVIMFVSFYVIYSFHFRGSVILAFLLVIAVNFTGISYAILLSEIFSMHVVASFAVIATCFTAFTTNGVLWPSEGMYPPLYSVVKFTPISAGSSAMTNIITRAFNFLHPNVLIGFISNIVWTILFTALIFLVHRMKKLHK